MDAGLPGKGARAVFPFSPQEKNSFLDAFVVGGCFCRCFEKTSPPNFPLSWEFPPLSRKSPPFTGNPPFSFLPREEKYTRKQWRLPGFLALSWWLLTSFPWRSAVGPARKGVLGGLFFIVRGSGQLNVFCAWPSAESFA